MLLEADADDFALLLAGAARHPFALVPDDAIAPHEVLQMLADLASSIRPHFAPCAWLIVDGDEVVGLLTAVRPPADGELHIGYGIAPTRQRRGLAAGAVKDLAAWATADSRIDRITAETAVDNPPSQRVLERNGFRITGRRRDPDDGDLLTWERKV